MPFAEQKRRCFSFRSSQFVLQSLMKCDLKFVLFLNTCADFKSFFPFLLPLDDLKHTKIKQTNEKN